MTEKRAYCEEAMNQLYPEVKRTLNPDIYKVSGTKDYVDAKEDLIVLSNNPPASVTPK